jgi:hypothetical protein
LQLDNFLTTGSLMSCPLIHRWNFAAKGCKPG